MLSVSFVKPIGCEYRLYEINSYQQSYPFINAITAIVEISYRLETAYEFFNDTLAQYVLHSI